LLDASTPILRDRFGVRLADRLGDFLGMCGGRGLWTFGWTGPWTSCWTFACISACILSPVSAHSRVAGLLSEQAPGPAARLFPGIVPRSCGRSLEAICLGLHSGWPREWASELPAKWALRWLESLDCPLACPLVWSRDLVPLRTLFLAFLRAFLRALLRAFLRALRASPPGGPAHCCQASAPGASVLASTPNPPRSIGWRP
jgi:hypothetical protein